MSMIDPERISELEIKMFFDRQGAWDSGDLREVVEKDRATGAVTSTLQGQDPAVVRPGAAISQ